MELNLLKRGNARRGKGKFQNKSHRKCGRTNRGLMFTPVAPGVFCHPSIPFDGPQIFGGPSEFNKNSRSTFGKFLQRNFSREGFTKSDNTKEFDLTKPWVTAETTNEDKKKQDLFDTLWGKTEDNKVWSPYEVQKLSVQAMNNRGKNNYVFCNENVTIMANYYCETCDKSFKTNYDFVIHEAEHETCNRDGCKFVAHPKIIAKHIKMQHESGLYQRIGKLYSEEDIAKWINERKKHYPTRKAVEEKKILDQEKLNRGERLKNDVSNFNKYFKNKSRKSKRKNFEKQTNRIVKNRRKKMKISSFQKHLEGEAADYRKDVPAFSGIRNIHIQEEPEKNDLYISDDEWEIQSQSSNIIKPLLNSSLVLLAKFYNSDEESLNLRPQNEIIVEKMSGEDRDVPQEVKTISIKNPLLEERSDSRIVSVKNKFLGKKMCEKKINIFSNQCFLQKRSLTLLEKLLKNEIRHERNVILQCIHFVVKHHFFNK